MANQLWKEPYDYDIIIPHYGIAHLTDFCLKCLRSLREHADPKHPYRLIFVDNASPEFNLIKDELDWHNHLLIRNTENLGFIKAVNQGLAMSTAPYVVMLNNDTEVAKDWLRILREPLETGGCGLSGPLSTARGSWQGNTPPGPTWEVIPKKAMLAFFCTMFRKEVFDRIGFLDTDFGAGLGDDDWFCHKATQAGFRLALCRQLVIRHGHRSTFKEIYGTSQIANMQMDAMKLLRRKQAEQAGS